MQKNTNEEHTYLDYVEVAVVKYDSDGCLQYYNNKFKSLYSYTDSDLYLGVHFSELGKIDLQNGNVVTTEYSEAKKDYLAIKAKYRSDLTGSFTVQLKDGRFIKTTDRLLPDGGFISVQTDVTELEGSLRALETKNIEAEGARAEAESWLQVLETSPSATLLRDSSFIIRNASDGWTRMTGFSRDETIGRDFLSFLVEGEQDRAEDARQQALKAIETGRDEARNVWTLRTNSGAKLQVTIMGNAVAGPTAQEAMVVVSITNITDLATQKALADTLLNRNAAMIISQSDDWKIQTCSDAWINQLG
ncbi:MAG: PAS-domain containing protein, partial [Ascidiaceihabitans sp.]|nr:PAS-domain containing protein [Ascidiaceihabitans sp.]